LNLSETQRFFFLLPAPLARVFSAAGELQRSFLGCFPKQAGLSCEERPFQKGGNKKKEKKKKKKEKKGEATDTESLPRSAAWSFCLVELQPIVNMRPLLPFLFFEDRGREIMPPKSAIYATGGIKVAYFLVETCLIMKCTLYFALMLFKAWGIV
jgi:hypothetical protein